VSLLKLQLAGAQHRETLATQALSHVRQLSDQLSESLAREQRLASEISELKKLVETRLTRGSSTERAETGVARDDEMRKMREEIAELKATVKDLVGTVRTKTEQLELYSKENYILRHSGAEGEKEAGEEGSVYDLADEVNDTANTEDAVKNSTLSDDEEVFEGTMGDIQGRLMLGLFPPLIPLRSRRGRPCR
jgi:methyl-accepting chemotaxis protein